MGSFYMEATQINYRRDETVKTVDQKLQELSQESAIDTDIAPVFKSTITYAPGDMVYYRNKLYVFNVEHSGAWAAGDVTATNVTTAIKNAAAVKADEADIAPAFDATASYTAGDLVYYGGIIYRCTNDHSGDWDADDFSATTITGELASLKSGLMNVDNATTLNTQDLTTPSRTKNLISANSAEMKALNTDGTWSGDDYTVNGVTFACTFNSDGYLTKVHVTGTASADAQIDLFDKHIGMVSDVKYRLNGLHSQGSSSSFRLTFYNSSINAQSCYGDGSGSADKEFTYTYTPGQNKAYIRVFNGYEIPSAGIDVEPQIRLATITDATFAPYIPSVDSRLDAVESGLTALKRGIHRYASAADIWLKICDYTIDSFTWLKRKMMISFNGSQIKIITIRSTPTDGFDNNENSIAQSIGTGLRAGLKVSDDKKTITILIKGADSGGALYTVLSESGEGGRARFIDPEATELTDDDINIIN